MNCFVRVLVFAGVVLSLRSESVAADGQVPAPSAALTSTGPPPQTEDGLEPAANRSAMEWFKEGVDAYLSENWPGCIRAFENSIVEWHHFRQANIDCRLRCGEEARRAPHLFPDDVEHLHYAEELVRSTLCIIKCKKQAFRDHKTPDVLSASEQKAFRDLKTYEYLQLCYYQASQLQKAASAVFTILSHDPGNDIMKHNFKFYMSTPHFDVKNIINYESERYVSFYLMGTEAYYREDYKSAITNLEMSLKEFYQAVNECRADCEGPFDQGWLPDFTSSVANHFVYCLKCKTKCHSKLSRLNGENYEDFLATHYHYLQFSYFKTGNLEDACAAAGSYLMFLPADETMLENIEYYKSLPKVQSDMFEPRPEAVLFIKREAYEHALLNYITDEFVFDEKEPSSNTTEPEEVNFECECLWKCQCISRYLRISLQANRSTFPATLLKSIKFAVSTSFAKNVLLTN